MRDVNKSFSFIGIEW